MDNQQQLRMRDKFEGKQSEVKLKRHGKGVEQAKQQQQQQPSPPATASPPSSSSSPAHEFSFTISLHPTTTTTVTTTTAAAAVPYDKARAPPSIAIDLSPADEIFFHGHLLPLHLLSHLPVSPRTSTNSLDSLTNIPKSLKTQNFPNNINATTISNAKENGWNKENQPQIGSNDRAIKVRPKSKSFSLFGLSKWKKGGYEGKEEKERHKRRLSFDVSHVVKRYMNMVRPLLSFRGKKGQNLQQLQTQSEPCSFSGNLGLRRKPAGLRGRKGEYSAPASMRTSPSNSGLLVAAPGVFSSSTSDSTMEELQAAIQAAIAHCKNSINAAEQKTKCQD